MRRSFLPDQTHRTGFITENAERKNLGRTDGRRIDKVAMGEVLSNLDQVFFDLPAAAGTPPGLSSGSQPYWGGVNKQPDNTNTPQLWSPPQGTISHPL